MAISTCIKCCNRQIMPPVLRRFYCILCEHICTYVRTHACIDTNRDAKLFVRCIVYLLVSLGAIKQFSFTFDAYFWVFFKIQMKIKCLLGAVEYIYRYHETSYRDFMLLSSERMNITVEKRKRECEWKRVGTLHSVCDSEQKNLEIAHFTCDQITNAFLSHYSDEINWSRNEQKFGAIRNEM